MNVGKSWCNIMSTYQESKIEQSIIKNLNFDDIILTDFLQNDF